MNVDRELGELSATVNTLEKRVEGMDAKLDMLVAAFHQNKGGLRVLLWVSGAAGVAGGLITTIASAFIAKP